MRVSAVLTALLLVGATTSLAATDVTTGGSVDKSGWGVWATEAGLAGSSGQAPSPAATRAGGDELRERAPTSAPLPPGADAVSARVCPHPNECHDEAIAYVATPSASPASHEVAPGVSDVARFLVGLPGVSVEPSAWTVAGAETNFAATSAGARSATGELLGQPVTVRFAPVAYHWVYGDGARATSSVPGASWQASALPPFSSTPTSHVFAIRGSYTVTVTVEFQAQYHYAGQDWRTIAGSLALTSKPVSVTVKSVKTVLVGQLCTERPTAPGCTP